MTTLRDREAADRRRKGLALAAVRRRQGHTQQRSADLYGVAIQTWQNYEGGKRHFTDDKLDAMLKAIGADREMFDYELAQLPEVAADALAARPSVQEGATASLRLSVGGVAHGGARRPNVYDDGGEVIDFASYFAPGTLVLRLDGMSMYPYAEPGGVVTYNPRHPPRRGHGCVIQLLDGGFMVKRFEEYRGDDLVVTELWPEEQELRIPLDNVAGVYAIGLRG